MSRRSLLFAAALALVAGFCFGAESAARTISTSGEATVFVVPDEVQMHFGVESFDASLAAARAQNEEACARLVRAVRGAGVEQRHIQADHAEVEIVYRDGGIRRGIAGYVVRGAYAVTLKDVAGFERLMDAALTNGANHLTGFEYRTTELRKHRDQARRMAIRAAREKAAALALELGCTVGEPRSIGESGSGWFGQYGSWWGYRGGSWATQNVAQSAGGGPGEGGETAPLGQIGIRASVSVTFDLRSGS